MAHKLKKFDNELHWRMATSGAYGLRVLNVATSAAGEYFCEIFASTASSITATAVNGSNLTAVALPAGERIQGIFSSVTTVSGIAVCKLCSVDE
jgi:hypothetical protein